MTAKKKSTSNNSGRATVRDVLSVVLGLSERIDSVNERQDDTIRGQQELSQQMINIHGSIDKLEKTTNKRLHAIEADVSGLQRPWKILATGWSKSIAFGSFVAALTGTVVKLELWNYLRFF